MPEGISRTELILKNRKKNGGKLICECGCGKEMTEKSAVRDHKDNNNKNNKRNNLQLITRACNKKKDPCRIFKFLKSKNLRLEDIYTDTYKIMLRDKLRIDSVVMAKNIYGKRAVRNWLEKKLSKLGLLQVDEGFYYSSAAIGDVNADTAEKWIKAMTSDEGQFRIKEINGVKYILTKKMALDYEKDKSF